MSKIAYCSICDNVRDPKYNFEYCKSCAGDWFCRECRFWNWAQNDTCIKCLNTSKPERPLLMCVSCGNKQYRKGKCNICNGYLEDAILYEYKLSSLKPSYKGK